MSEAPEIWPVGKLLETTASFLAAKGAADPRLDAQLLLSQVLGLTKVQLYINFERLVTPAELDKYRELVRRRARHEPVAYILGRKEFYGLEFKATPAALIPRPETEHLVDAALSLARELWPGPPLAVADIGCGGGAIALALAKNLPEAWIAAVDISPAALALARENAQTLGLDQRVTFYQGDLLAPLEPRTFQLICANLPYIPSPEMAGLMPDIGLHEPHLALDGGPSGLTLISRLLEEAPARLQPGGRLLLEIWPDSRPKLAELAGQAGFSRVEITRDLAGRNRLATLSR